MTPSDIQKRYGLTWEASYRLSWLLGWCAYYRIPFRVTSGRRSTAKQKALYANYLAGRSPYPVAPPGSSDHEQGTAFDASFPSAYTGVVVYLARYAGFRWGGYFSRPDPIHFYL